MLGKLLIISTILATGTSIAFAGGTGPARAHGYSFEANGYTYQADPYIGFSIGPCLNITGTPFTYAGMTETLSGGLSHFWDQGYYLAGEVFGVNSGQIRTFGSSSLAASVRNVRTPWGVGINLLPGIMINDSVLGYLRAGVINTNFQMDTNNGNVSENSTGWQVGAGFQTVIYKQVDIRAEYIYSQYPSVSNPPIGTESGSQVNLGLVYKFAC